MIQVLFNQTLKLSRFFNKEEEDILKDYIIKSSRLNYGLSRKGVCKLAYGFSAANNEMYPTLGTQTVMLRLIGYVVLWNDN